MIDWAELTRYLATVSTVLAIVYHSPIFISIAVVTTFILFTILPYYYYWDEVDEEEEENDEEET